MAKYRIASCKQDETISADHVVDAIMRAVEVGMEYMPAGGTDVYEVDDDDLVMIATVQFGADDSMIIELDDRDMHLRIDNQEDLEAIRAAIEVALDDHDHDDDHDE